MIRQIFTYIFLCFCCIALAQQDPMLMCINGKEVLRSEFEYFYDKNNKHATVGQKTVKDFADFFINYKLKVAAAEAAGIDTTCVFLAKLNAFRSRLIQSCLTDGETTERMARQYYDKMKASRRAGQVHISHIYKPLPQNVSGSTLRHMESQMDSIYEALKSEGVNANFDLFVKKFSDKKNTSWVSWLQTPIEFEDIIFSLQPGEISRPFLTPQGIYIVKVLEKKDVPPFEEVKDEIIRRQTGHHSMDKGAEVLVDRLKKEYHYMPDKAAVGELLSKGKTSRTLFTLAGQSYTGKDFERFAAAHPEGVKRQFAGFVMKTVLDYEYKHLDRRKPELPWLLQEYRDGLLLNEINNREFKGKKDEAELKTYFAEHRSDYCWEKPRYKGIVLHCVSKRVARQVRKFLKQLPEDEWQDAIRLTFNAGATPQVQAEKGLFVPGDNVFVDELVFKTKGATPVLSFPFTVVLGKKMKGPEEYKEVGEQLIFDYQNHLEQCWIAKLRAVSKVEINQEVLKTVNNH